MSDKRPKCPNTPKYPCGDCPACQVPPAASDSPSQPQDPAPPEGPAAGPGIAPGGLDAAGFGSWPSEEEILAHEPNFWLARQGGAMMALGWFRGDAFLTTNKQGRSAEIGEIIVLKRDAKHWTFCPIDDNGDKLDAAPVLRGEDARRLAEQLGQVAPPEKIARRRAEARRRLAESEAAAAERLAAERMTARQARVAGISGLLRARAEDEARRSAAAQGSELEFLQNEANRALDLRPLTKADRCPRCDEYVVPCPKCPLTSAQLAVGLWPSQWTPHRATCKYVGLLDGKACACNLTECVAASPLVTESLGSGVEAPAFKDEHVQMALDARELAAVKAELALTTQSLVDVTNKLNEATLRIRDLKAAVRNEDKYAVPVGPTGFENDRIGRVDHAARILATLPERSPDRRVLVVLRGLPGSGKSTVAQAIVDSDPGRWARVSKDDIRQMMVGPSGDLFQFVEDRAREVVVTKTAEEMTMSALRLGLDVVVDATNLTDRALNSWRMAAMVVNRDGRGPVLVCERVVPTSVEECVARDARRGARSVGRAVIERLAATIDVPLEDRNQEVGQ